MTVRFSPRFVVRRFGSLHARATSGLLALGLMFSSGCSITTKVHSDHTVSRSLAFGVSRPVSCDGTGLRQDSRTFGLGLAQDRLVMGYSQDDILCLPTQSCAAVFFVEKDADIQSLRRAFPDLPEVCVVPRISPKQG